MNKQFTVDFFSDEQYDKLTAEISYGNQILCQINQDQGVDNMEVEFFHEQRLLDKAPQLKFPLSDLLEIIERVKCELGEKDGGFSTFLDPEEP